MNPFLTGLQPLRRYADFRGRSTRTELIMFWIVTSIFGVGVNVLSGVAGLSDRAAAALIWLALLCPSVALWVRRLHDTGRVGSWLMLLLPGAAITLRREFLLWQNPFDSANAFLPGYIEFPVTMLALPVLFLLLRDDQEGPNAFGPNPRYPDDVEPQGRAGEPV